MGITIWGWGSCGSAISIWGWGDYPCAEFMPSVLIDYVYYDPYHCVPGRSVNVCDDLTGRYFNIFEISDRSINVCIDDLAERYLDISEVLNRSINVCEDDVLERSGAVCEELSVFEEIS